MELVKKITAEELTKIVTEQSSIDNALRDIGLLETQKHSMLLNLTELSKTSNETKAALEAKYGAVAIELSDGSFKEINKEDN